MYNNAIFLFLNSNEFHKVVAPIKIKIVIFQPSVRLLFLFKQMEMPTLFYSIYVLKIIPILCRVFSPFKNKYSNLNMKDKWKYLQQSLHVNGTNPNTHGTKATRTANKYIII